MSNEPGAGRVMKRLVVVPTTRLGRWSAPGRPGPVWLTMPIAIGSPWYPPT
jgi:hypothetical protein